MSFEPRRRIPGLEPEAERAIVEVQTAIARECKRLEKSAERPKRRCTELVEEGAVIAKPGEVVRVQPGEEDVTVVLPEPSPASDGEDIVISYEGDGSAAGRVLVVPANGTCLLPGIQTLNAPGTYRFTSTGGGATTKPRSSSVPVDTSGPVPGGWSGPPAITTDDLPPIDTTELVEDSVDNSILDEMPANSVKVNATGSAANPTDLTIPAQSVLGRAGGDISAISLNDLSVLGRAGVLNTNVAGIDVPGTGTFTGESVFLRVASTRLGIQWRPWTLVDMPEMSDNRFLGNISGAPARPAYTDLGDLSSDTIIYESTGKTFVRETMDGDVFSAQNSNVTLIQPNVVSDTKLRDSGPLSVIGRAANTTGDPADISAVAGSGAVLRESGSALGFGTIATAGLADDSVTNAKLAEMAANTVKANATSATANPTDFAVGTNTVLGRVAGDIVAAQLVTGQLADDQVTDGKLRNSAALSVIGRSANSTGDPADIAAANDAEVLRRSGTTLGFGTIATAGIADGAVTNAKLANMAEATIKGRALGAGTGVPTDLTGAQTGAIVRFAGFTGTVVAAGTYNDHAIADGTKVLDVDPSGGDVIFTGFALGTSNSGGFFTLGKFGASDRVVLKHSNAGSILGNRISCPGGVDYVLSADRDTCLLIQYNGRWQVVDTARNGLSELEETGAGPHNDYDPVGAGHIMASNAAGVFTGVAPSFPGDLKVFSHQGTGYTEFLHNNAGSATVSRFFTGRLGKNLRIFDNEVAVFRYIDTTAGATTALRWVLVSPMFPHAQSDDDATGDIVAFTGSNYARIVGGNSADVVLRGNATFGTVSNAAIRDGGALSVIGRSANSSGDVADISATAASGAVLRESGSVLGFGTVATAGIADNAVTDAKLRDSAAVSVIGRSANTVGDPADIVAAANDRVLTRASDTIAFRQVSNDMIADGTIALGKIAGIGANTVIGNATAGTTNPSTISVGTNTVLGRVAGNIVAAQLVTGQITDDAVTDGKLRNGVALSVIGRSANSTGDVADIAAGTEGHVLRRLGSTLAFGTIVTDSIADRSVTLAKMDNLAESRIIGRAEGAGTSLPQALTPTQVVSIIDGEAVTWTGSHTFNGSNFTVTAGADVTITASGGTTTLAATTQVQITSPTRLASSVTLDSVGSTAATAANNLAINSVNVVRFTGGMDPLTGMVPVVDGQTVLLVNAHASTNMSIHLESGSSSAANRFAGIGTSRVIRPGEMAMAWYDGADDRWRLLMRDEVDL